MEASPGSRLVPLHTARNPYEEGRRLLLGDVNGHRLALGRRTEIVCNDSHGAMTTWTPELLPPCDLRVRPAQPAV